MPSTPKSTARVDGHSEEVRERFRALWMTTPHLPIREIARQLGLSHNAIAGLRFRMGLPPRVRQDPVFAQRKPRIKTAQPLPPPEPEPEPVTIRVSPLLPSRPPEPSRSRHVTCRWPLWTDQNKPTHEYCGAPIAGRGSIGRFYCDGHAKRAMARVGHKERA
jgi:hypothetical protein